MAHWGVEDIIVIFHDLALRFGPVEAGLRLTPLCGREALMTAKTMLPPLCSDFRSQR